MNALRTILWSMVLGGATFQTVEADISIVSKDPNGGFSAEASSRLNQLLEKNRSLSAALEALKARNLPECERLITEAKQQTEDLPSVDLIIARWLLEANQLPASIARVEEHLSREPQDAEAYLFLAELGMRSGRWTEAWLLLEKAEPILNASIQAATGQKIANRWRSLQLDLLRMKGETGVYKKDWLNARDCFQKLTELQPDSGYPRWSLGRLALIEGDIELAQDQFNQARSLDPTLPQPELTIAIHLAYLATDGKRSEEAEKWFQSGIKSEKANAANWSEYAKWLLVRDRAEDVVRFSSKLKKEWTETRDAKFLLGFSYRCLDDLPAAEELFKKLHQDNPDDIEAADQLSLVLVEQTDEGKRARAKQLSDSNLKRASNLEMIVASAAWIEFKLGSVDQADKMLTQLVSATSISPQTAYYVAQVMEARGRKLEAAQVLKGASQVPALWVQRRATLAKLAESSETENKD